MLTGVMSMNVEGPKLVKAAIGLLIGTAPLLFWIVLYAGAKKWPFDLRPLVPWMRAVRYVTWGCGLVLLVTGVPWPYPMAFVTFSIGLSFPEAWARRYASSAADLENASPFRRRT
jgi:predicted RND superfamily exporter protein